MLMPLLVPVMRLLRLRRVVRLGLVLGRVLLLLGLLARILLLRLLVRERLVLLLLLLPVWVGAGSARIIVCLRAPSVMLVLLWLL